MLICPIIAQQKWSYTVKLHSACSAALVATLTWPVATAACVQRSAVQHENAHKNLHIFVALATASPDEKSLEFLINRVNETATVAAARFVFRSSVSRVLSSLPAAVVAPLDQLVLVLGARLISSCMLLTQDFPWRCAGGGGRWTFKASAQGSSIAAPLSFFKQLPPEVCSKKPKKEYVCGVNVCLVLQFWATFLQK